MIRITKENIRQFAELSGDHNPIHIDKEYAKTTVFKRRIAHGALVISYISREIAKEFSNSIIRDISFTFIKPAYIGDEIIITLKENCLSEENIKKIDISVINQNRKQIISGDATISIRRNNE